MNVLVVDDSSVDRHHLSNLLQDLGHSVTAYESTDGVLDCLSQDEYEVLFLDIVMPEQDGYKFLRELRSHPKTSEQQVVLYSTKGTTLEINYGIKRAGANHYMIKPATKEKLESVLSAV